MTVHLDLELLLTIIDQAGLPGVRDHGLLESAALRPQTSVFGDDAYPTLDEQAAALMESIVRHHPLVDGNKRLGWLATVVFYGLNGVPLDAPGGPRLRPRHRRRRGPDRLPRRRPPAGVVDHVAVAAPYSGTGSTSGAAPRTVGVEPWNDSADWTPPSCTSSPAPN
ncbi:type II toxin-antitoxin system death-on-curing family toxin [Tsukamurella tyrosinosolvens]|uniref:type II toxin-antitoxin system death-on-curing family toxin n=1 Tax=Tsukamurella tyrosinosolvens TaxID=57704 RepID=UPI000AE38188